MSWFFSLFYSLCNWCFSPHLSSLKHALLPGFQLKIWLFWTEQERLIFPPIVPRHILSFCCTGQSRPAVAELSFFCASSLFFCSVAPVVHVIFCESQDCEVFSSSLFTHFILFALSYLLLTTLPSTLVFSSCEPLRRDSGSSILPLVRGPFHSQTSHHRHAELTRGEEILT